MKRSYEAKKRMVKNEARRRRRTGTTVLWIVIAAITFIGVVLAFWASLASDVASARAAMAVAEPAEGIGREAVREAERYAGGEEAARCGTALRVYCETDDPLPEWWDPDHAEVVYTAPGPVRDIASPDWNLNTTLWGWDGHMAEVWELDLLARVFYLEFWGTSLPCSEAGCDAILNLWASGEYGQTLFDALSYYDPQYGYTYRVYPRVWTTNYDPDGLAWCKAFCTGRFINGPEWSAVYFQLGGYHDTDWVPPLYEMDGVYFSGARG